MVIKTDFDIGDTIFDQGGNAYEILGFEIVNGILYAISFEDDEEVIIKVDDNDYVITNGFDFETYVN